MGSVSLCASDLCGVFLLLSLEEGGAAEGLVLLCLLCFFHLCSCVFAFLCVFLCAFGLGQGRRQNLLCPLYDFVALSKWNVF